MEYVFFAALGLIVGSFLNVLIFREAQGESVGGRSRCLRCNKQLLAVDLIPVVSWVLLKGRCRFCHRHISFQYPLVELLTAVLFLVIGLSPLSPLLQIVSFVIVGSSIAIAVYDLRHMLIPDSWSYVFSVSALFYSMAFVHSSSDFFLTLVSGPLVALPLWVLWAVSHGRWMGFGDVKFAVGIGWLLGLYFGLIAILFSFILGAVISVCVLLPLPHIVSYAHQLGITWLRRSSDSFTMTSEVPFGPFLIASCLIVWFSTLYGIDLPLPWY